MKYLAKYTKKCYNIRDYFFDIKDVIFLLINTEGMVFNGIY